MLSKNAPLRAFAGGCCFPRGIPRWGVSWLYERSPLLPFADVYAYATKALALNEFRAPRYDAPPPGSDVRLGDTYLQDFGLPTSVAHLYGSVAFLAAYTALLAGLSVLAFVCVRFDRNIGSARTIDGDVDGIDVAEGPERPAVVSVSASISPSPASLESTPLFSKAEVAPSGLLARAPLLDQPAELPFERTTLAFERLTYTVRLGSILTAAGTSDRPLLRGISGFAEPGRLLALMGASGMLRVGVTDWTCLLFYLRRPSCRRRQNYASGRAGRSQKLGAPHWRYVR